MTATEQLPVGRAPLRVALEARQARRIATRLRVEVLESRRLMTAIGGDEGGVPAGPANNTIDRAADLGFIDASAPVSVQGSLGDDPAGVSDVRWYSFTLGSPALVSASLSGQPEDEDFHGVLSLYHVDTDYLRPGAARLDTMTD